MRSIVFEYAPGGIVHHQQPILPAHIRQSQSSHHIRTDRLSLVRLTPVDIRPASHTSRIENVCGLNRFNIRQDRGPILQAPLPILVRNPLLLTNLPEQATYPSCSPNLRPGFWAEGPFTTLVGLEFSNDSALMGSYFSAPPGIISILGWGIRAPETSPHHSGLLVYHSIVFLRPSSQVILKLLVIKKVPLIVKRPVLNKLNALLRVHIEQFAYVSSNIDHPSLLLRPDIVNMPDFPFMKNHLKSLGHILTVKVAPNVRPISVDRENEFRDKLLGKLIRAIDIVPSSSDHRQPVRTTVRHDKHLGSSFCGRVRVRGE
ncbi:glycine--tRNA ligase beta subunit [Striga asiatica]|uniref:Glycine--tRNA ligase beta subunit n=1 Tax=Striga asiatica TaxID=4170 RepID=A0A5A7RBF9_STRAF|nr:glycine--tRNA ligase beta subunit [Striga asiatica]